MQQINHYEWAQKQLEDVTKLTSQQRWGWDSTSRSENREQRRARERQERRAAKKTKAVV